MAEAILGALVLGGGLALLTLFVRALARTALSELFGLTEEEINAFEQKSWQRGDGLWKYF